MIVTILFLVTGLLLIFFVVNRLRKHQQTDRPSRRQHYYREPVLSRDRSEATNSKDAHEEDIDDALGLKKTPTSSATKVAKKTAPPQFIALYVMAENDKPYGGYELLQTLLANGLALGKQQVFEYIVKQQDKERVLFSVASAAKPGTFNLSDMGATSVPGLAMFLLLTPKKDNSQAFDNMLTVARHLVDDLGGNLLDEKRQTLSTDTISKIRKRIRQYEQTQLIPDLFDSLERV